MSLKTSMEIALKDQVHHRVIKETHVQATLKADKGDKAKLSKWSIDDFTQNGDNYATVVTCVKVSYFLEGKTHTTSYIVKVNPGLGQGGVKIFLATLFKKEALFYENILPALNEELTAIGLESLQLPRCYYTSLEEGQDLMFLEDLRLKGFKMFDRMKGMDAPHTLLVLKELARLHAASLLLQTKFPNDSLADKHSFLKLGWKNFPTPAEEFLSNLFTSVMENAAEILHIVGGYEMAEKWIHKHKTTPFDVLKSHFTKEDPFYLICHGDCWNNNMLFRYNDEGFPVEVMMVDLQLSQMASPATDLNYLMFTSLTGDVRSSSINEFLRTYYSSFNDVMETATRAMPFTTEQLLQEYRKRNEYGLLFALLLLKCVTRISKDTQAVVDNTAEGDKRKDNVLNMLETNPLFKQRLLAIFDDMTENGVFD